LQVRILPGVLFSFWDLFYGKFAMVKFPVTVSTKDCNVVWRVYLTELCVQVEAGNWLDMTEFDVFAIAATLTWLFF
jgi:hypothetical protein